MIENQYLKSDCRKVHNEKEKLNTSLQETKKCYEMELLTNYSRGKIDKKVN